MAIPYPLRLVAIAALVSLASAFSARAEMALDFSWDGVEGCRGAGISPPFRVTDAPAGTRTFLFTLEKIATRKEHNAEYGGSTVAFRPDGMVPRGAVYANGPCTPGEYQWIVVAQDAAGRDLATAFKVSPFPQ